mmetsp:Transcript_9902/g.18387  ORF Transcript_9902/g.18387 Transcript_9902/m.18387 type:complete len:136 (+) Transcript_9902:215-622(+)
MLKDMSTVGFLWRMVAIVLLVPAKEVPIANGTAGRILAPRELAQAMAATAIPYTVTDPIFELQQIRTLAEAITEHAEIFEPDRLTRPGSTTSAAAAVAAPPSLLHHFQLIHVMIQQDSAAIRAAFKVLILILWLT